jgi:hypothetical protein
MRTVVTTEGIFHVKETYEEIQQLVLQWDWIELTRIETKFMKPIGKITINRVQIVLFY